MSTDREKDLIIRQKSIRYILCEALVSSDNTVTLDDFSLIEVSKILKWSDGSDVTHTKATNVLTITEGLTDEKVVILAFGVPK